MGSPQLVAGSAQVVCRFTVGPNRRLSSRAMTSASHWRILKEAVLRCSGSPHSHEATIDPGWFNFAALPQQLPVWSPHRKSSTHSPDASSPLFCPMNPQPTSPLPLFSPTTPIVADSIIRNTHFFNVATHSFPGATVPVTLDKLLELLRSLRHP